MNTGVGERQDYIEEAWRIVDPMLKADTPVFTYVPGTWGPAEAVRIAPDSGWKNPTGPDEETNSMVVTAE